MTDRTALYAPLCFEPGPSRRLTIFLLAAHTLAATAVILVPLPIWAQLVAAVLLALSLIHGIRLHIVRNTDHAIKSALWDELGIWKLVLASGDCMDARLLPDSFVSLPLIVLNFRVGSRWRSLSLILTSDSIDADLLRKLRVRLKLEYGKDTQD